MIVLLDATSTSLTVSWPPVAGSTRYVLQLQRSGLEDGGDEDSFQTLADHLTATQARKRNLEDAEKKGFIFRVRGILPSEDDGDQSNCDGEITWITHSDPFLLLSTDEELRRLSTPQVFLGGTNGARVKWDPCEESMGYNLQMRENKGGEPWVTHFDNIFATEVIKKNITSPEGYQFRVRSLTADGEGAFSPPSDVIIAAGIPDAVRRMFQGLEDDSLLRGEDKVNVTDALNGSEFILLYASAHWCGPCRKFTPMLDTWYRYINSLNRFQIEVVFLSCDRDESSFKSYFATMPWLAVDFDDPVRERLLASIKVSGIPRLVVMDGRTGRIVVNNASGGEQKIDIEHWRKLAKSN